MSLYNFSYFVHVIGVVLWIGSFVSFWFLLRTVVKQNSYEGIGNAIRKNVNTLILPASILVVVSGSYMIMTFNRDSMPLYLSLMEMGGTMVILLSIIALSIISRKITKAVDEAKKLALYSYYRMTLLLSSVLGAAVVFIVALRLT